MKRLLDRFCLVKMISEDGRVSCARIFSVINYHYKIKTQTIKSILFLVGITIRNQKPFLNTISNFSHSNHFYYLYNKTRHSYIYMLTIAGQTAKPNGLKFFVDTHGCFNDKKHKAEICYQIRKFPTISM